MCRSTNVRGLKGSMRKLTPDSRQVSSHEEYLMCTAECTERTVSFGIGRTMYEKLDSSNIIFSVWQLSTEM